MRFLGIKSVGRRGRSWGAVTGRGLCALFLCAAYLLASNAPGAAARQEAFSGLAAADSPQDDGACLAAGCQALDTDAILTSERDNDPYLRLLVLRADFAPPRFAPADAGGFGRPACACAGPFPHVIPFHLHTLARSCQLIC
jgi:hypothetical protein